MFCEKCGNKIKEGYKFCDKCGTKVKEIVKKEENTKENKVVNVEKNNEKTIEENIKEKIVYQPVKKKSGKGKIVLLSILNILLLASTILFLVLWLTKPSDTSCSSKTSSYSDNKNEKKEDRNETLKAEKELNVVGKWEQNVDYKQGNEVVRRTYGMIELKSDGTFNSVHYDKDNMSNSERENGTYTKTNNTVVLSYYDEDNYKQSITLYIDDEKMCINKRYCDDYLVKDSYNNKITIYEETPTNTSDIDYINYEEYQRILNNKENAIVVVVREGCYYCEKYESVVEKIHNNYFTDVYYYENDNNIEVTGTPTTFIIKDGKVVDTIIGYYEYSKIEEKLESNNVF